MRAIVLKGAIRQGWAAVCCHVDYACRTRSRAGKELAVGCTWADHYVDTGTIGVAGGANCRSWALIDVWSLIHTQIRRDREAL